MLSMFLQRDPLYEYARERRQTSEANVNHSGVHFSRWERLLSDADNARVWKAISWKRNFKTSSSSSTDLPSDEEFKRHFQGVSNSLMAVPLAHVSTDVIIPVLDDPISPTEVENQIKRLKMDKACGPDGPTPGDFSMSPAQWLLVITSLFSYIFMSGMYPVSWTRHKMFTVFKTGSRYVVNNYWGINVMNSISKLYDMVLCNRLNLWYHPFREQAGAQGKRGCTEHIVALPLLTNVARRERH